MSLGKRIEKALPKVQPRIEDLLEVNLRDIEVRPSFASIGKFMN